MENATKMQQVEKIYIDNENRSEKGLYDAIVLKAQVVAAEACYDQYDYFRVLSALNLLNSAIKEKEWKHQLSYGFIKGRAASLFEQWICDPVEGVRASYNESEGAVFFEIEGIVFSYHNIRLTDRMKSFIKSGANKQVVWQGIRLQKIPVELFSLALDS